MKLRSLLVALAVLVTSAAAHAQGAAYLTPTVARISESAADNGTYSFLGTGVTSRFFYGVTLGGFYDIPAQYTGFKKVEIGVDLRDAIVKANDATQNTFALGGRVAFAPITARFHPYLEPFVAAGTTRSPHTAIHVTKLQYGIFGGADYDLNRHISFRAIEVGFSGLTTASDATIGASATVPTTHQISLSSGFTFRLP